MKKKTLTLVVLAFTLSAVWGLSSAPSAGAIEIKSWQAGTCNKLDAPPYQCTYSAPNSDFYHQAGGHPVAGGTDFEVGTASGESLKQVRVDLPEGLNVNPQAVPQCPKASFEANPNNCAGSEVGTSYVYSNVLGLPVGPLPFPVYNLVPDQGHPALFGFNANLATVIDLGDIFLQADIDWAGNYHEGFTIDVPPFPPVLRNRLVFEGRKGNSFITLPSPCNGDTTTLLALTSDKGAVARQATTPAGPGNLVPIDGCQGVPFNPSVSASAGNVTDSPAAVTATLSVPQSSPGNAMTINSSTVKAANVALPLGIGLNPSAAEILVACTDAQFGKGKTTPVACPAKSKIGTVSIQTPVLPANSLPGSVYLAPQGSRDPESGNEYRIFINAVSSRYGVDVRLVGNVFANAQTGRLTAVVKDAPQVTFSSFTLNFNGGEQAPLTSPPTCGPNTTNTSIVPWSGNAAATPSQSFSLTQAPGGGACAPTMASRPFAPGFEAAPKTNQAKAFTPFTVNLTRPQGQQELKGVNLTLPEGATAKLAGVPYCAPADFNAAVTKSGVEENKKPSCSADSLVGVATVRAGTGTKPLQISGKAYLAGPYKGAPLSIVVITPAVAGPFDLGNVVVRVALNLNPETAQINAVAELPDVFGGAKLDIRSVFVNVNRDQFTLNGTNCRKGAVAGVLQGGGADPTNPAAWSAAPVSAPQELKGCDSLGFKPKLKVRLFGKTKRNKHPKLRAELKTRPDDANVARASVALPHAIFLDQANLGNVCTRVQFAADNCPKKSVYGKARAFTPLLGQPLEGPIYLRSSNNLLPDLVAHLEGQVDIDLVGRIDSFKGGIRTTFDRVPDVPVTKFVVTLPGGKHGLLVNSTNLCAKRIRGILQLKGQNGKKANKRPYLKTSCKKYKKAKKHGKKKQQGSKQGAKNGGKKN